MRPLAALLLAVGLCSCQVATEGAPCSSSTSCPSGQGCGVDGRCSARALACAVCRPGEQQCRGGGLATCQAATDGVCADFATPVLPGPHQQCVEDATGAVTIACVGPAAPRLDGGCAAEGALGCDGVHRLACRKDADGCLAWETASDDCAGGLVCAVASSALACACPAPGATLNVDPFSGSDASQTPAPSGALQPPACRFKALAPALTAASALAGPAAAAVTVQAMGGTTTAPALFEESLPPVASGVSLLGGATADGSYVLEPTSAIVLAPGATLSGFVIQPGANGIDAVTTQASCTATETGAAVLSVAKVVGQNEIAGTSVAFVAGARQQGGCALTVRNVAFQGVATGVASTGGTLLVDGCSMTGGGSGIHVDGGAVPSIAIIQGTRVAQGNDSGMVFQQLSGGSVKLLGNTVVQNCPAPNTYSARRGGGLLFYGALPAMQSRGNTICGNAYDQVLVFSSAGTLDLTGDATGSILGGCTADLNQFTSYDGSRGVGIYSTGASVVAVGNTWKNAPPSFGYDFGFEGTGAVNATGAGNGQFCTASTFQCPAYTPPCN